MSESRQELLDRMAARTARRRAMSPEWLERAAEQVASGNAERAMLERRQQLAQTRRKHLMMSVREEDEHSTDPVLERFGYQADEF